MTDGPVQWSDAADEVFRGDITVAAAYVTPAGGAVADDGASPGGSGVSPEMIYAPHTSKGFMAPPRKNLLLVSNGLMAKVGQWQAGRSGAADRLRELQRAAGGERP
jgi:hypothetical protein